MSRSLEDQTIIITGASSGIGRAASLLLAEEGARVALAARRRERIEALAEEIRDSGGEALAVPTDVSNRVEVEALVGTTREALGPVDVLVNNAGVMPLSPLAELRTEDWERMVDVNVKGVLYALGAVLPEMLERRAGHIVNVGSLAGRRPLSGGTVYSATKFAVRALTGGIQLELSGEYGIRVTDIQPGVVDTELMDHIPSEVIHDRFDAGWQNRRKLEPRDVARAIHFALSAPQHVNVNEILVRPTDQLT